MNAVWWMRSGTIEVHQLPGPEGVNPHDTIHHRTSAIYGSGLHPFKSIQGGRIDPGFLISHRVGIEEVPQIYKIPRDKRDQVTKIAINPRRDQIGDRIAA